MSKHDDAAEDRLLRLNGQRPTARERWKAIHRLWRLSQGHGVYQDMAAHECFHVLMPSGRLIALLNSDDSDGLVDRSHMPLFLRKELLRIHRKQRLYAGHYEWIEQDKVTAQRCRNEHGIEVTPLEVAETRRAVINMARAKAAEMDFPVPADDEDLLKLFKKETPR